MGQARPPQPVKLFCGLLAADESWADRAVGRLVDVYGPTDVTHGPIPFAYTSYYAAEMGTDLARWFVAFSRLIDPGELSGIKCTTNAIERELAEVRGESIARRVNIDPGYLGAPKVVMATTKDFPQRVYLSDGIYAETVLMFKGGAWIGCDWTYPDYLSVEYQAFFTEARDRLLGRG